MTQDKNRPEVVMMPIGSVIPYDKNPRKNAKAVDAVAASIREFGFRSPIVVAEDMVVINGHTRLKAARKLGLKEVPVVIARGLTDKQISGYAQYNFAECVAEAVSDWHCNGSRAKKESRAIMAVINSELRKR